MIKICKHEFAFEQWNIAVHDKSAPGLLLDTHEQLFELSMEVTMVENAVDVAAIPRKSQTSQLSCSAKSVAFLH